MECIALARELLQEHGSLASLPSVWGCALPRGLLALLAEQGQAPGPGAPPRLAALAGLGVAQGLQLIMDAYQQVGARAARGQPACTRPWAA
jgi:hypothetical protein